MLGKKRLLAHLVENIADWQNRQKQPIIYEDLKLQLIRT